MKQKYIIILILIFVIFLFFSFQNNNNFQDNNNVDKVISDAEILIKQGNYSKALSILLNEFNKNKKSARISEKIASIFFSQQVYDLALKYYKIAYANGLKNVEIIEKIGESYAYINNNKKAIEYLKIAYFQGNSDPYYLYSLIWILLKEKKFNEAYNLLEFGNSMYPNLSYFIGARALYYANTFDIENARKDYEKVLLLTAYYSPIYFYNWGVMEYQLRNFQKAEDLFSQAANFSNFGEAFLALGEINLGKANIDMAERYFLRGKPLLKSPFILYDLIYLYSIKGEKEKLISVYKNIIKFPNKWWIYQYNLNLYEQMMNFHELEKFYFSNLIQLEKKSFYLDFTSKLRSFFNIVSYKILRLISGLRLRYYAIVHLMNINKNLESLNYYMISRKALAGFPFVNKRLILKEKSIYENLKIGDSHIYKLYLAQITKSKSKKEKLIDEFLQNADYQYEKLDILNALEMKAKINRYNIEKYIEIIGKIYQILPYYFNNSDLKIPIDIVFSGKKEKIRLAKKYFKTKGIILNRNSPLKLNLSCDDIFNFVFEYRGKTNFFSLTQEDIISDKISIYSNLLSILGNDS